MTVISEMSTSMKRKISDVCGYSKSGPSMICRDGKPLSFKMVSEVKVRCAIGTMKASLS